MNISLTLPPPLPQALEELRQALRNTYGPRLHGLYLYGSYARGQATENSDVDVLVILEGEVKPGAEIRHMNWAVSEICLRYDLLISISPVSAHEMEAPDSVFLHNVQEEAIPV